jgi:N-acetyl-anhydromuramyl-L-alanine amidase AmpD
LTGKSSADPADWYGAVAKYSQSSDSKAAQLFADRVFKTVSSGASRTTVDGQHVQLAAQRTVHPETRQLSELKLKAAATATDTECPPTVDCTFLAAAASNGQVAGRPDDGVQIKYIVLHDTESSYDAAIKTFQTAGSGDSAHYVMRASDAAVTQMTHTKDIAFHAGNYWFNMHSIGIEHEGYAAHGATWYSQAQYRATADLVKYLAAKYDIPLDREHIIGHDNVPGPQDSYVRGMHWDPGPYWDWTAFMDMVAPTKAAHADSAARRTSRGWVRRSPSAPSSRPTNRPSRSARPTTPRAPPPSAPRAPRPPTSFRCAPPRARTRPCSPTRPSTPARARAPTRSTTGAAPSRPASSSWSPTSTATGPPSGSAARRCGSTTPAASTPAPRPDATVLHSGDQAASLYGSGYPQASEYPSGLSPSTQKPLTLYGFPAGQAYVATQPPVSADDFFVSGDTYVTGAAKYYTIQYNHRVVLVDASQVS